MRNAHMLMLMIPLFLSPTISAEEPSADAVIQAANRTGGWVMHMGVEDGSLLKGLAQDGRFRLTGVVLYHK